MTNVTSASAQAGGFEVAHSEISENHWQAGSLPHVQLNELSLLAMNERRSCRCVAVAGYLKDSAGNDAAAFAGIFH